MEPETQHLTKKEKRLLKKTQKQEEVQKTARTGTVKKLLWWAIGVAGVILLFGYLKSLVQTPTISTPTPPPVELSESDHVQGATESAKLLIEYSDLQCPACASYYPLVEKLLDEHGSDITFAYRHFPLSQIHKNAQKASYAAESAGKQEKFFEMVDILFTRQGDWEGLGNPDDQFLEYAKELGLDTEQFTADYASDDVKGKVAADYQSGLSARVNSTPTFFFNGEKLDPQKIRTYEEFVALLGF